MSQQDYDTIQKSGIVSINVKFESPANTSRLKLVVRDTATGLVGSIELPVAVQAAK